MTTTITEALDTRDAKLRDARCVIRDLLFNYRESELAVNPRDLIDEITAILEDGYDFESGDCEE